MHKTIEAEGDFRVAKVQVEVGQSVPGGTLLLSLDPVEEEAREETGDAPVARESKHAELLILGGGPGGYVAALYAAKKGKKVTLVEKGALGGTCLNVGCIPTKALVKSSEVYHHIKEASAFGIEIEEGACKPNLGKIIERKDQIVAELTGGVGYLMEKNGIAVLRGEARFLSDKEVLVAGEEETILTFDDCIVATGSKIAPLPFPGADLPCVLNSTTALANRDLPKSLSIIGAGVIGLEFAFLYARLGVKVTVVEYLDRILPMVDADVASLMMEMAKKEGIKIVTGAKVTSFKQGEEGEAIVEFEKEGKAHLLVGDKVIVAIGRAPNLDGLGVENTGLALNERGRGIKVDGHMRTNVPHVYAIGDVNNLIQLAHAASAQGILAVDDIFGVERSFDATLVPSVIFTAPEIATIGLGEDALKKEKKPYKKGYFAFEGNGKAKTMNERDGFVKVLAGEDGTLLGGTIVGPDASSLIAALTIAVTKKMKASEVAGTIFAHPTTSEALMEACFDVDLGALHS